jgi:hypothetical protein
MVEMLDPKPTDTVCDPACCTGGFLIFVMLYLYEKYSTAALPLASRKVMYSPPPAQPGSWWCRSLSRKHRGSPPVRFRLPAFDDQSSEPRAPNRHEPLPGRSGRGRGWRKQMTAGQGGGSPSCGDGRAGRGFIRIGLLQKSEK